MARRCRFSACTPSIASVRPRGKRHQRHNSVPLRRQLAHKLVDRRPGDVAVVYGDASLALKELGWKAELGLTDMCEDSWRWISNNPNGFDA